MSGAEAEPLDHTWASPTPEGHSRKSCLSVGQCTGRGCDTPCTLPERTVLKQGALTPCHRAPSTAAAAIVVALGVASEALASSGHGEGGCGPVP